MRTMHHTFCLWGSFMARVPHQHNMHQLQHWCVCLSYRTTHEPCIRGTCCYDRSYSDICQSPIPYISNGYMHFYYAPLVRISPTSKYQPRRVHTCTVPCKECHTYVLFGLARRVSITHPSKCYPRNGVALRTRLRSEVVRVSLQPHKCTRVPHRD